MIGKIWTLAIIQRKLKIGFLEAEVIYNAFKNEIDEMEVYISDLEEAVETFSCYGNVDDAFEFLGLGEYRNGENNE